MKTDLKWCESIVKIWQPILDLHSWRIDVKLMPEDTSEKTYASCSVNQKYLEATIKVFPNFWSDDGRSKELDIIHELCHCHTQQMRDMLCEMSNGRYFVPQTIDYEWELLTQKMAYIAFKTKKGSRL